MPVYLRLTVAGEAYALPVEHALEVAGLGEVTPVPGARPEVLGVQNMRGALLPVADLASMLGISGALRPGRLLVTEHAGRQAGLAVDEVQGIGELPGPAEGTESGLLAGSALSDGDLVGVIDVPRVFGALAGGRPGREAPRVQKEAP